MGCPTSYDGKNAIWSKGKLSQLTSGTSTSGVDMYTFNYNAYGQRTSKTYSFAEGSNPIYGGKLLSSEKRFYYDHAGRLIAENTTREYYGTTDENENIVFLYDGNTIVGLQHTVGGIATPYYFHRNPLGDVVGIYDMDGTLVAKYIYDAWGNCTISGDTTNYALAHANPIRYRGYYYDEDTGLYYCNARYYSPKWRRFISPETNALNPYVVNGLNTYVYANNNPIEIVYSGVNTASANGGRMVKTISHFISESYPAGASNAFGFLKGLHWPEFSFGNLAKDLAVSLGEVFGRSIWGLTKDGRTFSTIYTLLEGNNGYTVFDNLPSITGTAFKGISHLLMTVDVISAGYDSYLANHSFGQGALNVVLTAGKNLLVYKASTAVATTTGMWVCAKYGATLGAYAGPVGLVVGAVAGTAVGFVIDQFGDVLIDWVVGWFD